MITYNPEPLPFVVRISPPKATITRFDRFKIWFWNLILPPHIRLEVRKTL